MSRESAVYLVFSAFLLVVAALTVQTGSAFAADCLVRLGAVGCLLVPLGLRDVRPTRRFLAFAAPAVLLFWFAGVDTPFQWDGVQTAVRAEYFWQTASLDRFSLFYIVMAPLAGPVASTIPAHLFCMTLGVFGFAAVALGCRITAGRRWAQWMLLVMPVLPPLYILYRFAMIDTMLVALWALTLTLSLRWSPRLTTPRLAGLLGLVVLTALVKEMGALVAVPVGVAMVALAPRGRRRMRLVIVLGLAVVMVAAVTIMAGAYARAKGIDSFFGGVIESGQGLTFLLFNDDLPEPWFHYAKVIFRQHLCFWLQSGMLVPMVFAFVHPRRGWPAWLLAGTGCAAQLAFLVFSRPHKWTDVYTYPLFDGNMPGKFVAPALLFIALAVCLVVVRRARVAVDRSCMAPLSGLLLLTVILHLFVKAYKAEDGEYYVWQAWHYLPVLCVTGVYIAARGLRRMALAESSPVYRMALLFTGGVVLMSCIVQSTGMAMYFRSHALARMEAYRILRSQPGRIVYTHWPFAYAGSEIGSYDAGPLQWSSDGWSVLPIQSLADASLPVAPGSLVVWDEFHSYGVPKERILATSESVSVLKVQTPRMALFYPGLRETPPRRVYIRRVASTP